MSKPAMRGEEIIEHILETWADDALDSTEGEEPWTLSDIALRNMIRRALEMLEQEYDSWSRSVRND